ncbi:MAG: hypothetical protein LBK56_04330 [Gracilibacteraceae bacterium]|nr:hypothetical protein [Gracilibacteraceae bacterium]
MLTAFTVFAVVASFVVIGVVRAFSFRDLEDCRQYLSYFDSGVLEQAGFYSAEETAEDDGLSADYLNALSQYRSFAPCLECV